MQLLAKQRGVKGAVAQLDQRLYNAKLTQDGDMQCSAVQFSILEACNWDGDGVGRVL